MKSEIGIAEKSMNTSVHVLATVLADEMTLYVKTRKFHWNVSGQSFMELHKLFEAQYNELEETIDEVAERINKLGSKTIGTMKEFIELSRIKETPNSYPAQADMLRELLEDHELLIAELRKDIEACDEEHKDVGTIDFLTKLLQQHETTAWILRRYSS